MSASLSAPYEKLNWFCPGLPPTGVEDLIRQVEAHLQLMRALHPAFKPTLYGRFDRTRLLDPTGMTTVLLHIHFPNVAAKSLPVSGRNNHMLRWVDVLYVTHVAAWTVTRSAGWLRGLTPHPHLGLFESHTPVFDIHFEPIFTTRAAF